MWLGYEYVITICMKIIKIIAGRKRDDYNVDVCDRIVLNSPG